MTRDPLRWGARRHRTVDPTTCLKAIVDLRDVSTRGPRLVAHAVVLEAIVALRPLLAQIGRMNRDLHDQIRCASNSMGLNIGEAAGSLGGK